MCFSHFLSSSITETLDGSDIEHVYCKKVRRAQEAKGLLTQAMSPMSPYAVTTPDNSPAQQPQLPLKEKTTSDDATAITASTASIVQTTPAYGGSLPIPAIIVNDQALSPPSLPPPLAVTQKPPGISVGESTPHAAQPSTNKRSMNSLMMRSKKFRFLKNVVSLSALNETKVDDVTTDIIIPRERVISICSLDKDALDGYLNEGDNDTQDTELLQYFQHPSTSVGENSNKCPAVATAVAAGTVISTIAPPSTTTIVTTQPTLPLLENYQLYGNSQVTVPPHRQMTKKQEQINELRQYLQQNLHAQQPSTVTPQASVSSAPMTPAPPPPPLQSQPPTPNLTATVNLHDVQRNTWQMPSMAHSASASLTMMSHGYRNALELNVNKRTHVTGPRRKVVGPVCDVQPTPPPPPPPPLPLSLPTNQQQNMLPIQNPPIMRSMSSTMTTSTQQSPNSRRKNFSFVPISPGPQTPRVFTQPQMHQLTQPHLITSASQPIISAATTVIASSPFVSPRTTPGLRRQIPKDLATSIVSSLQTSDTLIGSCKTAFSKPNQFKSDVSASAPTSPASLLQQQNFQFNHSLYHSNNNNSKMAALIMSHQQHQLPSQQQQQSQSVVHHQPPSNLNMCPSMMENRSQSVPLHCQSPAFNSNNPTAYSSACNSIAQTPVPSEYADFCDENLLNILADSDQTIKMETNDIPDMLDVELSVAHHSLEHLLPDTIMRGGQPTSHHLMSRSVPSTPLPHMHYNHNHNNNNNNNHHNNHNHISGINHGAGPSSNSHQHTTLIASNKMPFDISKSVPTTPIGHASVTPFCYSPDQNRDFLINGNSVELKTNPFILHAPVRSQHAMATAHHNNVSNLQTTSGHIGLTTNELEDLSNYSDVNDPIIDGSDLLESL